MKIHKMLDKLNIDKTMENIGKDLNIQLEVIDRPNCSELIFRSILSVDDVPFGLNKGVTFVKTFGATILIVSTIGNYIKETKEIKDKCIYSILDQCNIMNSIYGRDKGVCYYSTSTDINTETGEESNKYKLKVDTPRFLDRIESEELEKALRDNLETLKKLSVSVKGVIYTYTGYEDN